MHFCEDIIDQQSLVHCWYEMQLKKDFHKILKLSPALPNTGLKETFKLMEHVKLNNNSGVAKANNTFWDFDEV